MKYVKLRTICLTKNTLGVLTYDDVELYTQELPWKNNANDESCIPAGQYYCKRHYSHKNGHCYHVTDVVQRKAVQIHVGNYTKDTLGCILPGLTLSDIDRDGTVDVASSTAAMKKMFADLGDAFMLVIERI